MMAKGRDEGVPCRCYMHLTWVYSVGLMLLTKHFPVAPVDADCPPPATIRPCVCTSSLRNPLSVNVTCLHVRSWKRIKAVARWFRLNHVVQRFYVERLLDRGTEETIGGVFSHLKIEELILTGCLLPTRNKNFFGSVSVFSLVLDNVKLIRVPRRLLSTVEALAELHLNGNAISSLKLKDLDFENDRLALLDLDNNRLAAVPTDALRLLNHLEILVLSHNRIRALPKYCFAGLNKLVALELSHNPVQTLSTFTFLPLVRLRHLGVAGISSPCLAKAFKYLPKTVSSLDVSNSSAITSLNDLPVQIRIGIESLVLQDGGLRSLPQNLTSLLDIDFKANYDFSEWLSNSTTSPIPTVVHLDASESDFDLRSLIKFPNVKTALLDYSLVRHLTKETFSRNHQITVLHLSGCGLRSVNRMTFWHLRWTLSEVDLSLNSLRGLSWRLFYHTRVLESLDLSYNLFRVRIVRLRGKIRERYPLDKRMFGRHAAHSLKRLSLVSVSLPKIPGRLLRQLSNLEYLNLAGNKIRRLHLELLPLGNLVSLNLNNNEITSIDPRAFNALLKLRHLNLASNRITDVRPIRFPLFTEELYLARCALATFNNWFLSHLRYLRLLDLSHNSLSYLDVDLLKASYRSLLYLDISGNPLNCTCQLLPLVHWIQENDVETNAESTLCVSPASMRWLRPFHDVCWQSCQNLARQQDKAPDQSLRYCSGKEEN